MVARSVDSFGAVPSVLVLNAATIAVGKVTEVSDPDWERCST